MGLVRNIPWVYRFVTIVGTYLIVQGYFLEHKCLNVYDK